MLLSKSFLIIILYELALFFRLSFDHPTSASFLRIDLETLPDWSLEGVSASYLHPSPLFSPRSFSALDVAHKLYKLIYIKIIIVLHGAMCFSSISCMCMVCVLKSQVPCDGRLILSKVSSLMSFTQQTVTELESADRQVSALSLLWSI